MSKLFIERLGPDLYTICYTDNKTGEKKAHKENWKPLSFKTQEEAEEWLAAVEAERKREDKAKPFTMEEAEAFVKKHEWTFATTYAKTAPHEYLVKARLSESQKKQYERFVATMKANSVEAYFYTHKNNYFILGDNYYWFMGQHENMAVDLINRTKTEYLDKKEDAYYYNPERVQEDIKKWEEGKKRQKESIAKAKPSITFANDEFGHIAAYRNGAFEGHVVTMETHMFHENAVCKPGNMVQHFKRQQDNEGNNYLYKVIGKATHTDTDEDMVVYQALYGDKKIYVRPLKEYLSKVDRNKYPEITQLFRFEYYDGLDIGKHELKDLVRFELLIGGFNGCFSRWTVQQNDGKYKLSKVSANESEKPMLWECSDIDLSEWYKRVKELRIHKWQDKYINRDYIDGTQWSLTCKMKDGAEISIEGSNDYPNNWAKFRESIDLLDSIITNSEVDPQEYDKFYGDYMKLRSIVYRNG